MITIKGKEYRNLQEQVQKNMDDIDNLQENVQTNTEDIDELKNRQVYTKSEADAIFQTKIGMALYATQQQLNLNIAATEARTDLLLANKQDTLVSGTNIKTVNGNSLLGSGNINISTNYTAGTGININNGQISVDNTVAMKTDLDYNNLSNKPDLSVYAKLNDDTQTITASSITVTPGSGYIHTTYGPSAISMSIPRTPGYTLNIPTKDGILATIGDIPAAVSGINNGTNWTSITIGNDTYGIPTGGSGSIVAGTGIDITNGVVSVDSDTVVTKDSDGNVEGILQVSHLQSENWDEDDDNKSDIYLLSGLRTSSILLETSGEEAGSTITLSGTSATESHGAITVDAGSTTFITYGGRIYQKDEESDTYVNEIAYLSDIPTISGGTGINVNDGVVSVDNTVAMKTDIPTISGGTGINVSNGVVSVNNTVAMKTDIPAQTKLYAHKISFNITFAGSNNITGIASIISTSSTQITTSTALTTAVRERGVVPASGKYTGSSSANNGRVIELTYGQGSHSQLCAVVVYDYEDIIDVVSIAANTVTDTVTQI